MAISDGYPHNIERAWARGLGERYEKGSAIREMYFIIFPFHIAADIFFPPKTTRHCSASQLQIYMDIWPSIFRPYASGTLCINRKEDINILAFYKLICWPSQKECNLWNCYFLLSSKSRDTSSAIKDICVSIFKSYKNDMTLKRWL